MAFIKAGLNQESNIRNQEIENRIINSIKKNGKYIITEDDRNNDVFTQALNFIIQGQFVTSDQSFVYITEEGKTNWKSYLDL